MTNWAFETTVLEIIQRTPTIRSFRFAIRARNVRYRPGQFFFVTIKVGDEEGTHHFSFSSSPTEKGYVEFTKRITGSPYSQALAKLQPDAWAMLEGPSGSFVLPSRPRKLAFLTGGIGVTPQRSMLRYIADKGLDFDVIMLYGNEDFDEICFREELDSLAHRLARFRIHHVLSSPSAQWDGPTGRIDSRLVEQLIPDYAERIYYVSGPPRMVRSLEDQLFALGVPRNQVKRDSFTGYD